MTKKILQVQIPESIDTYFFDDTLDNIAEKLQALKNKYQGDFTNLRISVDVDCDNIDMTLHGEREETNAEYTDRIKKEQKAAERKRLIKERKEFKKRQEEMAKGARQKEDEFKSAFGIPKTVDLKQLKSGLKEFFDEIKDAQEPQ
jgi:hypothetical protein